jgi:hypothetical protein
MNSTPVRVSFLLGVVVAAPALAQSNIDPVNKFSWQENCGWMNWRDANVGSQGVVIGSTFLSGFAWGENVGYINFGDGTPGNGVNYANANGTDAGVNIVAGNELGGLAWGENVGWINFGPFASLPVAQHARVDFGANRLRGYAWGENIGWVNLDDANHFVGFAPACYPDCDADGFLTIDDFICFQTYFAVSDPYADCDADGVLTIDDFICFQTYFAIGC